MKKAVAIRHVNFENLGILGSLLSLRGYQIDYYDAGRDDIRAINNEETDLLVVLGGPISAAQHFSGAQRYDFLDHELALVKQRLAQRRATLGVCLGAQVIAQALGADVISLGVKEIGFAPLTTLTAQDDSVLAPLADTPVLHWHGDMFMIPEGARCLAGTAVCPHHEAAMVELLGRNLGLSAVFAYNDSMAAGALTTLKDNGIAVPQHLSLIGFDDIPISRYTDPQLTTVRYPIMSMAKLATELALQGAAGKLDRDASHCFMPTLVRRHSVAQRQIVGPN